MTKRSENTLFSVSGYQVYFSFFLLSALDNLKLFLKTVPKQGLYFYKVFCLQFSWMIAYATSSWNQIWFVPTLHFCEPLLYLSFN